MDENEDVSLEEEKKKVQPKEEIVPKVFHKYMNTVFSEREVGRMPPRTKYDHKIDLKPGFEPKRGAIFRQGPQHDQELREFIDKNSKRDLFENRHHPKQHHSS